MPHSADPHAGAKRAGPQVGGGWLGSAPFVRASESRPPEPVASSRFAIPAAAQMIPASRTTTTTTTPQIRVLRADVSVRWWLGTRRLLNRWITGMQQRTRSGKPFPRSPQDVGLKPRIAFWPAAAKAENIPGPLSIHRLQWAPELTTPSASNRIRAFRLG